MRDNTAANLFGISAWLPVASLALTAAAFGLGAPARIARSVHRASAISASLQAENSMRDEHVMFPMRASASAPESASRFRRLDAPIFLRR